MINDAGFEDSEEDSIDSCDEGDHDEGVYDEQNQLAEDEEEEQEPAADDIILDPDSGLFRSRNVTAGGSKFLIEL